MIGRCMVFATLLSVLVNGRGCQFFYNSDLGYAIGTGRCNSYVFKSGPNAGQHSFIYECNGDAQSVNMYTYSTPNCVGLYETTTYSVIEASFDCTATKENCGEAFGYKTPCGCDVNEGTCDAAVEFAIVLDVCLINYDNSTGSYMWNFECNRRKRRGSSATVVRYLTSDCTGTPSGTTSYPEGCFTNDAYMNEFGNDQIEWIVCSGNMATWSLSLFALLIITALSFV